MLDFSLVADFYWFNAIEQERIQRFSGEYAEYVGNFMFGKCPLENSLHGPYI